ncbi:TrbI/VirB10 family protein [uncultured Campylobacter sp.]|uniref:TrbI/VirB10 family protein n=1 Tax=uncultured Campylobacter sp. TaxID=218934 RepID=UPI002633C12D|nr:TrbI/VirB10 family protein [uncultured Campylobacter sp.]
MTSVSKLGIKDEEKRKNLQPNESPRNAQDDILNDYIQMMSRLQPGQAAGVAGEGDVDKDAKAELFLAKKKNEGYLEKLKQKQISPYEIKAGWTIPAILITGINSDLPGQILAQVSQNVYDTATGEYLLIPQGTKVVGAYSSNIIYGQSRILIAWNKLIFPNGDTLDIENMQGTSPDGYSGFTDQVDNHYFRIFGSAFLMSAITAGISLADHSNTNSNKETNADKAIAAAIQQMGAVASEMIRKNMNISPTLEIRPGYKFNIFVTKDIVLEPLSLE